MYVLVNATCKTVHTCGSRDITRHIFDVKILPKYFKFHKNLKISKCEF
jgi:hypothetical protein